jgi:N-acetylmuramoyl-L-alanine amidase
MRRDMPATCWRGSRTRSYGPEHPQADYYGVLRAAVGNDGRRAARHALLIEHGFHSNPEECAWLMKPESLQRLAEAEAQAIADFFGLAPKEPAGKMGAPSANGEDAPRFRVQAGAFARRENAENLARRLRDDGYQTVIKED